MGSDRTKISFVKACACVAILAVLALWVGCAPSERQVSQESEQLLQAIDDSLDRRSPEALGLIRQGMASAPDSLTLFEFRARLVGWYLRSATPDTLLALAKGVEDFAIRQPDTERKRLLLAYIYNCEGSYYHSFHDNSAKVVRLYRKAYELLMASEDKTQAPKVCANLGDAYSFESDLPATAEWYRRALFLADSLRLPDRENVTLYLGLAWVYQHLGDYDTALQYYKRTECDQNSMSVSMQAYFLNNFGTYYYYKGDYRKSLEKFMAMRRLLEQNHMEKNFDMYLCKLNLADVFLNLGQIDSATCYIDEVEPFVQRRADLPAIYYCHTIRIGIAVAEKDWASVSRIIDNEGDTRGIDFSMRLIRSRYLRQWAVARGDYARAYSVLCDEMAMGDSLEHNRTNMRTADIMGRLGQDTLRLHNSLAMAERRAEQQRLEEVVSVGGAVVVVVVLVLLLGFQRSRKRLAEARMRMMDLKLNNVRNRISPHFTFNVLNNHILSADAKEASDLTELSRLIRASLDLSRSTALTLEEELDFVKQYVHLEQPMLGNDFDFSIRVADGIDCRKVLIPSMFVQIVVENAIVHGLSGWEGHKMLHIDVEHRQGGVAIDVVDNGPGFEPGTLSRRTRTGFEVIRQTLAYVNYRNRKKMLYHMSNVTAPDGHRTGCKVVIFIPDGFEFRNK